VDGGFADIADIAKAHTSTSGEVVPSKCFDLTINACNALLDAVGYFLYLISYITRWK
jgi:hypothetical protein